MVKHIDPEKDVFISYARGAGIYADGLKLVDKLKQSFAEKGSTFWQDKEDIYGGEEWWAAIKHGITDSSVFLLILNEPYLHSAPCNAELTYAHALGKRIIPVLEQDLFNPREQRFDALRNAYQGVPPYQFQTDPAIEVDQRRNWYAMQAPNGIHFVDPAGYSDSLKTLIEAIHRDPEFLTLHRDILRSALEWQADTKRNDLLWSGERLHRAEQWLIGGKGAAYELETAQVEGRFIDVQRDFIIASQRFVRQRRRNLGIVGAIVMVALALLTVFAFSQRAEALVQRAEALVQRNEALNQRNEAQRALQNAALANLMQRVKVGVGLSQPLLWQQSLWVTSQDGQLIRLSAASGERLSGPIPVGRDPGDPFTDGHDIWVLSRGEGRLVRVSPDSPANPVSIDLGIKTTTAVFCGSTLWAVDDHQIVWFDRDSTAHDVSAPLALGRIIQAPVADPGGAYLWAITNTRAFQFDCRDAGRPPQAVEINGDPMAPVFAFGSLWITDRTQNDLLQINPAQAQIVSRTHLEAGIGEPQAHGRYLYVIDQTKNDILQIDPTTRQTVPIGLKDAARQSYFLGETLWAVGSHNGIATYRLDTAQWLAPVVLFGDFSKPVSDGLNAWFTNRVEGSILAMRLSDGKLLHTVRICPSQGDPVFDGANIWVACPASGDLIRIPALLSYYELGVAGNTARPARPIYDGQSVWLAQQATGTLVQLDPDSGRILTQIPIAGPGKLADPIYEPTTRSLWIVDEQHQALLRIKVDQPDDIQKIDLAGTNFHLQAFNHLLWVAGSNIRQNGPDLMVIDPHDGRVLAAYDVGMGAVGPAYAPTSTDPCIWFSGIEGTTSTIYRLNASDAAIVGKTKLGAVATAPSLVGDSAWVVSLLGDIKDPSQLGSLFTGQARGLLYHLRRTDGTLVGDAVQLDRYPHAPLIAGKYLWITQSSLDISVVPDAALDQNKRGILAVDINTGQPASSWELCPNVSDPYFDGILVWFVCLNLDQDDQATNILAIRADNLQVVRRYESLGRSAWPAVQFGNTIWIVYQGTGNVAVFRAGTGELLANLALGRKPSLPTADEQGFVWVANADDSTVQRISQQTIDPLEQTASQSK